ncbi:MAG: hypothetical protein K0B10_03135 [Vicingaceae bacterium]|nr:hypothetical protein [Vicingaceae bacterium]
MMKYVIKITSYLAFLLITFSFFSSCESKKDDSESDKYLKKIRNIYYPLVENHSLVIIELFEAYKKRYENNEACDKDELKKLNDLRKHQAQLILDAKVKLDSLPDDGYGYVSSVRSFANDYSTYGIFVSWDLFLVNLSYYSPDEHIVFLGSYSNDEPIWDTLNTFEMIKIDTTEHFGLTHGSVNRKGFEGFNGLIPEAYILQLIKPIDNILFRESIFCIENVHSLSKRLANKENEYIDRIYEIEKSLLEKKN